MDKTLDNSELIKMFQQYNKGIGWSIPLPPKGFERSSSWIQLLSYGSLTQPTGSTLKFSKAEADTYIPHFHSPGAIIARLFKSISIVDDNKTIYGSFNKMETRCDGVYASIKWQEAGKKLLSEEPVLFFTPVWILFEDEETPGVLVPAKLVEIIISKLPYPIPQKTKRKKILKTKSITDHLLGDNHPIHDNRKQFMALIHNHMQKTGQDFSKSWSYIKQNNPELYENSF